MTDPLLPVPQIPPFSPAPPAKNVRPWWVLPMVAGVSAIGVAGALVGALVVLPTIYGPRSPIDASAETTDAGLGDVSSDVDATQSRPTASPGAASGGPATGGMFVAEAAGFSAVFPGKPTKATAVQLGAESANVQAYIGGDGVQSLTVQVLDQPCEPSAAQAEAGLGQSSTLSVASAAKQIDATYEVLSETPRDLDGHHGLQTDFTLDRGAMTVTARFVMAYAGKHFYAVQFASVQPDIDAWDAFIKSFKSLDSDGMLPACAL